jgi:hypothetical protein
MQPLPLGDPTSAQWHLLKHRSGISEEESKISTGYTGKHGVEEGISAVLFLAPCHPVFPVEIPHLLDREANTRQVSAIGLQSDVMRSIWIQSG